MSERAVIPVIALLGPTAVGKSGWAFKLACENNWEILSCDSRQIYRRMDVGTAKPSKDELQQVHHWMVDICEPDEEFNAYRFAREALMIIRKCADRNVPVLLCGGTGLYFKALSEGQTPLEATKPDIRQQLITAADKHGCEALYNELSAVDADSAGRIHPNDLQRIIRALGYFRQTGMPISQGFRKFTPPTDLVFYVAKMTLDRPRLYDRINRRTEYMFKNGLYEEFLSLRSSGYNSSTPGLMTVGYRELFAVEQGKIMRDTAIESVQRNSRHYAKRQITWFSRQLDGTEFNAEAHYEKFREFAEKAVRQPGSVFE